MTGKNRQRKAHHVGQAGLGKGKGGLEFREGFLGPLQSPDAVGAPGGRAAWGSSLLCLRLAAAIEAKGSV